ncbi:putative tetratricopeptide-like helical domain superfamily [Helianthus annuus]|nr:putative tetratricopeptide-like helical domain superfamily [Helianthus annuus]KAJ0838617.1 putative tetratricopeptide-like helical domain superfamily [Helianthus annuus]
MKITFKTKPLPSFLTFSTLKQSPRHHSTSPLQQPHIPTNTTYQHYLIAALKSSSSHPTPLKYGRHLHSHILKYGHDSNIFIRNSLISLYAKFGALNDAESIFVDGCQSDRVSCNIMLAGYVKFGRLNDARQLFDKMPGRNNISFTTMIMGLGQSRHWYEVMHVFKEMRLLGLAPNEVTLSSVISSDAHVSGGKNGHMLHGLVVKSGLEEFNLVVTNLVHVYCACSCLDYARILFDGMSERNVVSWNVMLNGYSKARLIGFARDLFDEMPEQDVVSWGTIIECVLHVENLSEALTLYREMVNSGIGPNDVMLVDIISACGQVNALSEGQQFHGISVKLGFDCHDFMQSTIIHFYSACNNIKLAQMQFKIGSKNHLPSWNALISGLVRNGMIDSARELFDKIPSKDVFSWSSMIAGYAQTGQPDTALQLFREMIYSGVKPNEVTMVSMLSSVANLGSLQEGRWAHEFIISNSIPINDNLTAAIVDMYAKCGSINTALQVFNQVKHKVLTISPWNAIICGLAMHGHARTSLELFSDLLTRGIPLNSITFIGVLSACCHAGLVEEGERHFKSMKNVYNVEPNIKHYGCMVDLLGRAGRLKEAEEMINNMPMKADAVIWGTLLAASRNYGNVEIGEKAAENLANAEPSHGPGRILLSNLYVDAGRLDDAAFVRHEMQTRKLTRSFGYSGVI